MSLVTCPVALYDAIDAKAEVRAALERLAARHTISAKDIAYATDGYADNLLDDAIYNVKRELEHEIDDENPVEDAATVFARSHLHRRAPHCASRSTIGGTRHVLGPFRLRKATSATLMDVRPGQRLRRRQKRREVHRATRYRPDSRYGDGSGVPRRVGIQSAATRSIGSIAVLDRPNSRLRAVRHPYLPQNRLHMDLDRRLGDFAGMRDHLVGVPFYESIKHLGLAL